MSPLPRHVVDVVVICCITATTSCTFQATQKEEQHANGQDENSKHENVRPQFMLLLLLLLLSLARVAGLY
jgi:hypothetical protein